MSDCKCGDMDCFLCYDPDLDDDRSEEIEVELELALRNDQPIIDVYQNRGEIPEHPLIGDLRAVWDRLPYLEKMKLVYGCQSEDELTSIWIEGLSDCPIGDIPDLIEYYEDIINKSKK